MKEEHIDLCLNYDVAYQKSNEFEQYDFIHEALTIGIIDDIKFDTQYLGKTISYPFIISSMTGGTEKAKELNEKLAIVANELNIPSEVGSQRKLLESPGYSDTFKYFRENTPYVPVMCNIGSAQIVQQNDIASLQRIIETISADGLIIHLNPLQELLQKEGEINFKGLLQKIDEIKTKVKFPIIVKEAGSGISQITARKLLEIGVDVIDVSVSGGTFGLLSN